VDEVGSESRSARAGYTVREKFGYTPAASVSLAEGLHKQAKEKRTLVISPVYINGRENTLEFAACSSSGNFFGYSLRR
jgi:hypothetical protein